MNQQKIFKIIVNIIILWIASYFLIQFVPTWVALIFCASVFFIIAWLTTIFDEDVVIFSAIGFAATIFIASLLLV